MSCFDVLRGDEAVAALAEFAASQPSIGFFQGPGWLTVWNALPRYEGGLLVFREGGGIVGCFPFCVRKRSVFRECYSMPMGTYGGAVSGPDYRRRLADQFVRWSSDNGFSRVNVVEFEPKLNESFKSFEAGSLTTQVLDLGLEAERLFEGLSDHHKRRLKKADRFDIEIRQVQDDSDVKQYFHLMKVSAERRRSRVPYGLDFYLSLRRHVSPSELVWRLLLLDGKPCAGHICFRRNGEIISWDGCSNRLGRATSVNYLLYWHSISEFNEQGCVSFNFGASPTGVDGVVSFKGGWGAREAGYHEYDRQSSTYRSVRRIRSLFRR